LSHKELLDQIAATPFGRRYRSPRMDLWYYFAHRAFELLRPGGTLAFITNSYWTKGTGASRLIKAFRTTAHLDHIIDLGAQPVFPGVSGRHLIFRATAGASNEPTYVEPAEGLPFHRSQQELFQPSGLDLEPGRAPELQGTPLGDLGRVRQGIAENPASINARTNRQTGGKYRVGEGVFVVTPEEAARLALEPGILRPYHTASDLGRYRLGEPSRKLVYSCRDTWGLPAQYPRVAAHLERFRELMEARRETRKGHNQWWHLHWPREEEIWRSPKLIALQMALRPSFAVAEVPVYVPFSVNVFVPHANLREDLHYLAALLNSKLFENWFRHHAKMRGISLELNGHLLSAAPIRRIDFTNPAERALHDRLAALARNLMKTQDQRAEAEIDALVQQLYA
jgi:hypothetical protein